MTFTKPWVDPRATPLDVKWEWPCRSWRVHGPEGDYGLVPSRKTAIKIAIDAAVTGGHAIGQNFRRIHVFDTVGVHRFTIIRVKGRLTHATPQFFQDNVT